MTHKYDSLAERRAAPIIAALGGKRCDRFNSPIYRDAAGLSKEGKPDFVFQPSHGPIYVELKDGELNDHYDHQSSHEALASEYMWTFHKPATGLSHSALSTALHNAPSAAGRLAVQRHAFNHSIWKLLALQAHHGWRHYVVCFVSNPKPIDAERYCAAGLVWCTLATLPQLLVKLRLEAEGISIPFVHRAQKFGFEVAFDDGTATPEECRSHFLAAVDADRSAKAAQRAEAQADAAAGISPF